MEIVKQPEVTKFAKFVQILDDEHNSEFVCELPIGPSFNDGTGILFYKNRGFIPYDEYVAKKHAKEVVEKQAAEKKK